MKKLILISLCSTLSFTPILYAGTMCDSGNCGGAAFFSLEGGYTWNESNGYNFTVTGLTGSISSVKAHRGYSGRLAAGMISMVNDELGFTGELGWGYYGNSTATPAYTGVFAPVPYALSNKYAISGFDALAGVSFVQPYYSLYFKAGALIQNMHLTNYAGTTGITAISSITEKHNQSAALPELKVGAAYNIDTNWSITGAYMFAYGASSRTSGIWDPVTSSASLTVNTQNPTISTALLGVQYTV